MTVIKGIFRAIDIGLHSRDFHTAQSAHCALVEVQEEWFIANTGIVGKEVISIHQLPILIGAQRKLYFYLGSFGDLNGRPGEGIG